MLDSALATYSYNEVQFAPAGTATDVWQLTGPTGLTGKIRWIEVGGTAAAVRTQTVSLIKRSATDTGGTSTARTIVKADSADVASFSVMTRWTVNPAGLGAAIGQVDSTTFTLTTGATTPVRVPNEYSRQPAGKGCDAAMIQSGLTVSPLSDWTPTMERMFFKSTSSETTIAE